VKDIEEEGEWLSHRHTEILAVQVIYESTKIIIINGKVF
jgi:hypothetical protein